MKVLGVIPARIGSTRLERKPLQTIAEKTLIEWVWGAVGSSSVISRLIVATDSDAVREVVEGFGGEVMMTDEHLQSGSERVAQVVSRLGEHWDAIVNIQGDMPFISGELIDSVVRFTLQDKPDFGIGTAAAVIEDEQSFKAAGDVKVLFGHDGAALYFSRSPIPYSRDGQQLSFNGRAIFGYKHIGLYVFRPRALQYFEHGAKKCELEEVEKLEQLRALAAGERIGVFVLPPEMTNGLVEVDTVEDLLQANRKVLNK